MPISEKKGIGQGGNLKLILGIVLIAVVAGAGYYAYQATQTLQVQPTTAVSTPTTRQTQPTTQVTTTRTASIIVKWLGHSSFMIKAAGKTIYTDPYVGEYVDKADLILVSHSHSDHMNTTYINKVRRDDTVIIAPANCAAKIGGTIKSLKPGEKTTVGEIVVEAVEAYNFKRFRSPGNPYHPKGFGVGYLLTIGGKIIYHAGDTDFIDEMKTLKGIHLALLPSGGTYTMDNPEVVEATLAIKPKFLIPMHRWDTDPSSIKKEVEAKPDTKVLLLKPGEQFEIE